MISYIENAKPLLTYSAIVGTLKEYIKNNKPYGVEIERITISPQLHYECTLNYTLIRIGKTQGNKPEKSTQRSTQSA